MRKTKLPAATPSAMRPPADAQAQLESFLAKYDPEIATFARRALAKLRKLVRGAIEMVYDNYNWLVIGYSPSERPSEAIFSLVLPPGRKPCLNDHQRAPAALVHAEREHLRATG
jgi:hypothetical protein